MSIFIRIFAYICLLWVGVACTLQPQSIRPEDIITPPGPVNSSTSTPVLVRKPVMDTVTPAATAINRILTTNTPVFPTATPVELSGKLIICSPLEHETVSSLGEIISDPYHPPPPGRDERHHGVDFSYYQHGSRDMVEGEGIQSILPGIVASVIHDRLPYGNMVIIETPGMLLPQDYLTAFGISEDESLYHLYAHMNSLPLVQLGDEVACGQLLGNVGMTGYNIVNPHLHLETRIGPSGAQFTEMAFYTTSASNQEMENYKYWRTSGEFRHFDPMSLFTFFLQQ